MWKWVFLFLGICLCVVADDVKLSVSIRKKGVLRGVKSCVPAVAHIEILNKHRSEPITVTSIKVEPEKTYYKGLVLNEPLPPQLQVPDAPVLTLEAGQTVTMPLNFFPKYPHESGSTSGAPQLSSYESVDFKDMVGEAMMGERNNFRYINEKDDENEYEVRTKVVVETSRGRVQLPVTASSVRYNDYHLPDRIQFFSSSSIAEDTVLHKAVDRFENYSDETTDKEDMCYKLFMRNPQTEPLTVQEVVVSRPDLITIYDRMIDPDLRVPRSPSMKWGDSGRVILPDDNLYIATICPKGSDTRNHNLMTMVPTINSSWIVDDPVTMKTDISLGFLLLRTAEGSLLVWLERYVDMRKYHVDSKRRKNNANQGEKPNKRGEMSAFSGSLVDYLVPQVQTQRVARIPIKNEGNETIKIMRVSVVIDKTGKKILEEGGLEFDVNTFLMDCGTLDLDVPNATDEMIAECETYEMIEGGKRETNGVQIEYGFKDEGPNSYFDRELPSNSIIGRIVVRGTTDVGIKYREWRERMLTQLKEGSMQGTLSDIVLEIPFEIKVVGNRMRALTDGSSVLTDYLRLEGKEKEILAYFFPFRAYDMRLWNVWPGGRGRDYEYDRSGIAHSLRIFGYTHENLNLTNLGLESDNDDPNSHLCERFYAALGKPKDNQSGSFRDLGHIALSYDYDVHRDFSHVGIIHPVVCYLTYNTHPVNTGDHSIMLVIFPGNLELTTSNRADMEVQAKPSAPADSPENIFSFSSTIQSGMKAVLNWYSKSSSGQAFEKYLQSFSSLPLNGTELLRNHLSNIANVGEEEVHLVDPIIVNVGAIARGEKKETPLHITNHNPVPVQVFIDRSEVEGMSLSVMRDGVHTSGDGNHMLDYLPKKRRKSKIEKGRWKGHNREALRRFLETNEYASIFFLSFMHRNNLKPNPSAMKRLPILKELYKLRAKADFNMDAFSFNLYNEANSKCISHLQHPSNYYKFNSTSRVPYDGPTLVSDDLRIIHHLAICDPPIPKTNPPKDLTNIRQAPVTIPPGGTLQLMLSIKAPDMEFLEKDITKFIGSGLVLSTDHGQIIPILVTFETLLGQLVVSPNPKWKNLHREWQSKETKYNHYHKGTILQLPSGYFVHAPVGKHVNETSPKNESTTSIRITPSKRLPLKEKYVTHLHPFGTIDMDLHLTSSFSRDIMLRKIESCNPLFQIDLNEEENEPETFIPASGKPYKAIRVGKVRTTIPCPSFEALVNSGKIDLSLSVGPQRYPSFFQCALEWIRSRRKIQVEDCGLESMQQIHEDTEYPSDDDATNRAITALNRAISFIFYKYNPIYLKESTQSRKTTSVDEYDKGFAEYASNGFGGSLKAGSSKRKEVLDRLTIDVFAEVTDAWRTISELDLHTMSTSLRATIEYEYSDASRNSSRVGEASVEAGSSQSLTVPLKDLFLRSHMSIPRLVKHKTEMRHDADSDSSNEQDYFDTSFYSVVDFPPTPVAEISEIMIQLHNPTPHPVKIKLAAAMWETIEKDLQSSNAKISVLHQEGVRDNYMGRFGPIYPQTRNGNVEKSAGGSWWDGTGGFYQADYKGNLIQSRHNETVPTADETYVSSENPYQFAHSSFIVGCGLRCGQRDETLDKSDHSMMASSPIGAAAAAGFSLVGKSRQSEDGEDGYHDGGKYDAYLSPGAEALPENAPAAFALPYSSFDEIVLPPFSSGEVGPVLFRPPGRYGVLGCDAVYESDGGDWQTESLAMCKSKVFETLVFLENSLTGLERVVLRGKALWERVVFFDEVRNEDVGSQFSDLEYRYGRTALMFPGTAIRYRPQKTRSDNEKSLKGMHPILKTVRVANMGDFTVEYSGVYLGSSSRSGMYRPTSRHGSSSEKLVKRCSLRSFTIYGCHENDEPTFINEDGQVMDNLLYGFKLKPNETIRITVEHTPDCIYKKEFISLHIIRKRTGRHRKRNTLGRSFQSGGSKRRDNAHGTTFKHNDLELLIGYDMSDEEAGDCIPYSAHRGGEPIFVTGTDNVSHWNTGLNRDEDTDTLFRRMQMGMRCRTNHLMPLLKGVISLRHMFVFLIIALSALTFLGGWTQVRFRSRTSKRFLRMVKNSRGRPSGTSQANQSKWAGAFRCLARSNPTATELQAIGKEQNRLIVIPRLKNNGVLNLQCINSSGVFQRDRPQGIYGVHSRGGREGSVAGGAEKNQFLSDTLFHNAVTKSRHREGKYLLPCGLGSKAAMARGMISRSLKPKLALKSNQLYRQRRSAPRPDIASEHNKHSTSSRTKPKEIMLVEPSIRPTVGSNEHWTNGSRQKSPPLSTNAVPQKNESNILNPTAVTNGSVHEPHIDYTDKTENSNTINDSVRPKSTKNDEWVDLQTAGRIEVNAARKQPITRKISSAQKEKNVKTNRSNTRHVACDITLSSEDSSSITSSTRKSKTQRSKKNVNRSVSSTAHMEQGETKESNNRAQKKKKRVKERKFNVGQVVPHSPSSIRSSTSNISNLSSRTESTASSIEKLSTVQSLGSEDSTSLALRPPPGLGPPPGFGSPDAPSADLRNALSPPLLGELPEGGDSIVNLLGTAETLSPSNNELNDDTGTALGQLYSARKNDLATNNELESSTTSLFNTIRAFDEKTLDVNLNSSALSIDALNELRTAVASPSSPEIHPTEPPAHTALPGGENLFLSSEEPSGFNVMDFLDNILEEPRTSDESPGLTQVVAELVKEDEPVPALPLLADPWGVLETSRASRATAYGIAVEDDGDGAKFGKEVGTNDEIVQAVLSSLPLQHNDHAGMISSAAIMPAGTSVFDDDHEDDKEDDYNNRDFYAKLLG